MVSVQGQSKIKEDVPMACRGDEVQHDMHAVVPEARVTLDTALFSKNVIVLSLEVSNDLRKAGHDVSWEWQIGWMMPTWPRCRSGLRNRGYRR